MDFNYFEAQIMYNAVLNYRDDLKELLEVMSITDPDRNQTLDFIKYCNSILRKVKHEVEANGSSIVTP